MIQRLRSVLARSRRGSTCTRARRCARSRLALVAGAAILGGCESVTKETAATADASHDRVEDPAAPPATSSFRAVSSKFIHSYAFLEVRLAGDTEPRWFLLDCGFTYGAIDESLVQTLGWAGRVRETLDGQPFPHIANVEIDCDGDAYVATHLGVSDLSSLSDAIGFKIDGVAGIELFHARVVRLDYQERSVELGDPDEFAYKGAGFTLPAAVERFVFTLATVAVAGEHHGARVVLDTGCSAALVLSPQFAKDLGLETSDAGIALSVDGEIRSERSRIDVFQIGKFNFGACDVRVEESVSEVGVDAVVGAGLLDRFVCIFDARRECVILEPGPRAGGAIRDFSVGLQLVTAGSPYDRILVRGVGAGSAADRAGLQANDELLAVEHRPVADLGLEGVNRLLDERSLHRGPLEVLFLRSGERLTTALRLEE